MNRTMMTAKTWDAKSKRRGESGVPWFSSWLSFLCVKRIIYVEVSKAAYCCTFICQYP
jgi:hypothetical protein